MRGQGLGVFREGYFGGNRGFVGNGWMGEVYEG